MVAVDFRMIKHAICVLNLCKATEKRDPQSSAISSDVSGVILTGSEWLWLVACPDSFDSGSGDVI